MTLPEATVAALEVPGAAIARRGWSDLRLRPEHVDGVILYHVDGSVAVAPIVSASLPRADRRASDWEIRSTPCA